MEALKYVEFGDLEGYLTVSQWKSSKKPIILQERKKYVDIIEYTKIGMIDGVRELISLGADVNEKDTNNNCAIIWAVRRNDMKITKLLVSAGADLKSRGAGGHTLLMVSNSTKMRNYINKIS